MFLAVDEFLALESSGGLLNHVVVGQHHYGLQAAQLDAALARGERLVLHLTHDMAQRLKGLYPGTLVVLVRAPSVEEQVRRLRARGATDEEIARRMADPEVQDPPEDGCDLVLVNETGEVEEVAQRILDALGAIG